MAQTSRIVTELCVKAQLLENKASAPKAIGINPKSIVIATCVEKPDDSYCQSQKYRWRANHWAWRDATSLCIGLNFSLTAALRDFRPTCQPRSGKPSKPWGYKVWHCNNYASFFGGSRSLCARNDVAFSTVENGLFSQDVHEGANVRLAAGNHSLPYLKKPWWNCTMAMSCGMGKAPEKPCNTPAACSLRLCS